MAQVIAVLKMIPTEFKAYGAAPANAEGRLELIGGEVVEVVSGGESSSIATRC